MKRFKNFFKYLSTFFIVSLILLIINGCGQQEKQEATQVPAAEKTENKIVTQAPTKEKTASIKKETPAPVPEKTDTIRRAMRAPAKEKIERTIIGARIPKKKKAERPKRIIVLSERPLSKSLDKEQPRATSTAKEDYIPNFPWPPPKASSVAELPNRFFIAEASKQVYLRDIDLRLSSALEDTGYYDKSYYSVPAGFAIVTRLEQIYQDGKPKPLPQRWSVDVGAIQDFSISTYIKALFTSNPGYFRVIVFIVTHYPFTQSQVKIDDQEAIALLYGGLNKLPESIGRRPYTDNYSCNALIYEFEKKISEKQILKKNLIPGKLTGRRHLVNSKLWNYLER